MFSLMLPSDIIREIILYDINNLLSISLVCKGWHKVARILMTRLVFSRAIRALPSISLLVGDQFSIIALTTPNVVSVRITLNRCFSDRKDKLVSLHYIQRGRIVYLLSERGLRNQHRNINRIIWRALEGMKKPMLKVLKFCDDLHLRH